MAPHNLNFEDQFIDRVQDLFSFKGKGAACKGIGDDCAVVPLSKSEAYLITTDALVDKTHFLLNKITPKQLAIKSLAVNISDVAAMGGTPCYAFLTLALPKQITTLWLNTFFKTLRAECKKYSTLLLGGDTVTTTGPLLINITLVGKAKIPFIKYRYSAKINDVICLTRPVGDSEIGLRLLKAGKTTPKIFLNKHICPIPELKVGQWLGKQKSVHAMMDLSDGLLQDLERLIKAANLGAAIHLDKLPISQAFQTICSKKNWDPYALAATSGEEYALLFTVDQKHFSSLEKNFYAHFNTKLYPIGSIVPLNKGLFYFLNNKIWKPKHRGYAHFKQPIS